MKITSASTMRSAVGSQVPDHGQRQLKRLFDVIVAGSLLLATSPLQGVIAVLVRWRLGTPVLFNQQRPGIHGQPFVLVKFRTMLPIDVGSGWVTDEDRMTPLGRFLRAASLDELPTLWNVIRGDMSLVGPRPLLMQYLGRYTATQARRHEVRPGITGLAQITGRNATSWEDRLRLDVVYVDTHTLCHDISILCKTLIRVIRRDGISQAGNTTMSEFQGTADG